MLRVVRTVAIAVITAILFVVYILGPRTVQWRNRMVRIWARALSWCMGIRVSVDGPRPTGAFVLVANHVSYVDILLLSRCVDVVFVARSDVRQWPVLGALAASVGTIFIDRNSRRDALRVSTLMNDALRRGAAIALFPEGASSEGSDVLPFKPALFEGIERVHPAAIRYSCAEVAWYGDMTFLPHAWRLLAIRRIDAALRFGGTVTASDRKLLARATHGQVRALLAR
jgi:1-acyl-sn-glycerol-3-phosphate acyltransferase